MSDIQTNDLVQTMTLPCLKLDPVLIIITQRKYTWLKKDRNKTEENENKKY